MKTMQMAFGWIVIVSIMLWGCGKKTQQASPSAAAPSLPSSTAVENGLFSSSSQDSLSAQNLALLENAQGTASANGNNPGNGAGADGLNADQQKVIQEVSACLGEARTVVQKCVVGAVGGGDAGSPAGGAPAGGVSLATLEKCVQEAAPGFNACLASASVPASVQACFTTAEAGELKCAADNPKNPGGFQVCVQKVQTQLQQCARTAIEQIK